jgi:hypothetical protein
MVYWRRALPRANGLGCCRGYESLSSRRCRHRLAVTPTIAKRLHREEAACQAAFFGGIASLTSSESARFPDRPNDNVLSHPKDRSAPVPIQG